MGARHMHLGRKILFTEAQYFHFYLLEISHMNTRMLPQRQSDFLTEVKERELYEDGVKLTKRDPAHFVAVFNKQKGRAKEISKYAVASLHASKLLARQ